MMSWRSDHAEERRSIISTAKHSQHKLTITDIYWHLTFLKKCEQHTVLNYWWSVNVSASFSHNGALQLWAHPTLNSRCNPVTIDDDRKETGKGWEGKPGKPVWVAFSIIFSISQWSDALVPTSWIQDLWLKSTHLIHSLPAHQHLKLLAAALHAKQFIDSTSHQSFLKFCSTRAKRILAVLQSVLFAYLNQIYSDIIFHNFPCTSLAEFASSGRLVGQAVVGPPGGAGTGHVNCKKLRCQIVKSKSNQMNKQTEANKIDSALSALASVWSNSPPRACLLAWEDLAALHKATMSDLCGHKPALCLSPSPRIVCCSDSTWHGLNMEPSGAANDRTLDWQLQCFCTRRGWTAWAYSRLDVAPFCKDLDLAD